MKLCDGHIRPAIIVHDEESEAEYLRLEGSRNVFWYEQSFFGWVRVVGDAKVKELEGVAQKIALDRAVPGLEEGGMPQ